MKWNVVVMKWSVVKGCDDNGSKKVFKGLRAIVCYQQWRHIYYYDYCCLDGR